MDIRDMQFPFLLMWTAIFEDRNEYGYPFFRVVEATTVKVCNRDEYDALWALLDGLQSQGLQVAGVMLDNSYLPQDGKPFGYISPDVPLTS